MPSNPIHPRSRETRDRIIRAAVELFADPGYDATSLRDIAKRAEVSLPGLLRHYASKQTVLTAVTHELREEAHAMGNLVSQHTDGAAAIDAIVAYEVNNQSNRNYLELLVILSAEAAHEEHPAHADMVAYRTDYLTACETAFASHPSVHPERDRHVAARRFLAAADGLRLLALYWPDAFDLAEELNFVHSRLLTAPGTPGSVTVPPPPPPIPSDTVFRSSGQQRVIAAAAKLFERRGFASSPIRDIAALAGIAKSTVFHHFPSKEALLEAVLDDRDAVVGRQVPLIAQRDPQAALRILALRAGELYEGAIESTAYTVLCCEAAASHHPAHELLSARLGKLRTVFAETFDAARRAGQLPHAFASDRAALLFTAQWLGLQIQHLYEPEMMSATAVLSAVLDDLFVPSNAILASSTR